MKIRAKNVYKDMRLTLALVMHKQGVNSEH